MTCQIISLLSLFPFVQLIILIASQAVVIVLFIVLTQGILAGIVVIGIRNVQIVAGTVFINRGFIQWVAISIGIIQPFFQHQFIFAQVHILIGIAQDDEVFFGN